MFMALKLQYFNLYSGWFEEASKTVLPASSLQIKSNPSLSEWNQNHIQNNCWVYFPPKQLFFFLIISQTFIGFLHMFFKNIFQQISSRINVFDFSNATLSVLDQCDVRCGSS